MLNHLAVFFALLKRPFTDRANICKTRQRRRLERL